MKDCTVNILGTEYRIYHRNEKEDCELRDYENYKKSVLMHEIMHAFLYECGLDSCSGSTTCGWAINEEMVDWFSIISPKIFKVFQELDIL